MATKKTAVIPEEEILAAATEENINEHSLHQTETEPEPDRVLSAEGAPGDADLIDICQTDSESANPEGMPIEDAARNTPEAPVSQTDSDLEEKEPEESPPARRTRKPRAKKSESDTAAAEPPGDASDGVESPEKKPRRRAAARPASPVVSIDERPSVETEADKARNDLLDLVESLKTKRILTGTIQGIERPADHPSRSLAVIYHGDIKVIIPAEEAVEPPEDFRGRLPEDVLHYMVTKRLGAEVDYIIKGIDAGVDMFDCVMPTRNGRNGQLFTAEGVINIRNKKWEDDFSPVDPAGTAFVDRLYSKAYLPHLCVCGEMLAAEIASLHNIAFFLRLVGAAREHILAGDFRAWKEGMVEKLTRRL